MERPSCIYHGNDINVYLGRPRGMMGPLTKRSIQYSTKILQVFNFANFQPRLQNYVNKNFWCVMYYRRGCTSLVLSNTHCHAVVRLSSQLSARLLWRHLFGERPFRIRQHGLAMLSIKSFGVRFTFAVFAWFRQGIRKIRNSQKLLFTKI